MRRTAQRRVLAGLAVATLVLTACTKPDLPTVPPAPEGPQGEIAIRACTPEGPLLPAATIGPCGLAIADAAYARLVKPNPETGQPMLDLATAIDTQDSQHYTVRLARGRTFQNGTEVKAQNFVAAWNWAAYGPNRMPAQDWFTLIEGGAELNCPQTGPCSKDGRPTQLSGLKVVDDYTFTITTVRPIVDLQARLGHPVFSPLPDAFFVEDEGKDAFGQLPIGAGPFQVTGNNELELTLTAFPGYPGNAKPKVQTVVFRKYDTPERTVTKAYSDVVANALDFTEIIPTDLLVDDVWQGHLAGRFGSRDTQTLQQLNFVATDPKLADPRVRRAISMAIDRQALARQVFAGTRVPATSWVTPTVPGYQADACGVLCGYNLTEARALLREGGGYAGEFVITVNADGGNKQWADAVCNQLKNALALDCQVNLLDNQREVIEALRSGALTGLVRQGWTADYLSAEATLRQFSANSRLNLVGYHNAAFDAQLQTALEATSQSGANAAYRQAELLLAEDPPSIPLWFAATPYGNSSRVADVRLTPWGTLDLLSVRRV